MNIVLIGSTGFVGSAILKEAQSRGHSVNTAKVDVADQAALQEHFAGADAVISAFSGHAAQDVLGFYVAGIKNVIGAAQGQRLLVVGGAGSLEVAPGVQLIDTPSFPDAYKATAEGARQALNLLRDQPNLDWTMLSPSAMLAPGQRSGQFRLGGNSLLVDADGKSHISVEDYAVAMIDELEKPQHKGQRFTVGY